MCVIIREWILFHFQERTKNAQFVIISLRNNMFELADRLVGIYKTDNCTKSVTINPKKLKIGGLPSTQTEPAPIYGPVLKCIVSHNYIHVMI